MFRMREVIDEDGEIIKVHLSIGLPLVIKSEYDTGLAFLILFLLDVLLSHELADVAETLKVDLELLKVPLNA